MREYPEETIKSTLVRDELGKILIDGQSAGNLEGTKKEVQEGSSETKRKAYNKEFIEWLVGLAEGDESFRKTRKGLEFQITQTSKDADVLFYIKKELGFGTVTKQSETHQYKVRGKAGLEKIIEIFNGKLQLEQRRKEFEE